AVKQRGCALRFKRAVDQTVALGVLAATSPVLAAAALGVRATMGKPVFFTQTRPGKHGVPFRIYKLRTMRDARDASGAPLPDAERLTRLGRFLRQMSVDDLPN